MYDALGSAWPRQAARHDYERNPPKRVSGEKHVSFHSFVVLDEKDTFKLYIWRDSVGGLQ
jgi:hypothetical protein